MLKKTITYEDFDGNKRTEDFYFNMTKAELAEMQMSERGGLQTLIKKIIEEHDNKRLISLFKEVISLAYGKKSDDGRRFIKNKELSTEFEQTGAYSELFMELCTDEKAAADFVNGIIPNDIRPSSTEIEETKKKLETL